MSITIKIISCDGTGSVRRRNFDTTSVTLAQVQEFANLQNNAKLTWKDEDNDIITIATQTDLQEAVTSAVTQKSSLRLYVDHTRSPSAPTESEPTESEPAREQRSDDINKKWMKSTLHCARQQLFSAVNRAQSACSSSGTLQALKEDARSIRAVFEARVERNLSNAPILNIASFFVHAVLFWTLFWPSCCLLFKIAIAAVLMPRNALGRKDHKHVRILFALIGVRVALKLIMGFTSFMLPPFLFFGMTCCLVPKLLLGAAFFRCLCKKGASRRGRRGRHGGREHHRNRRTESQEQDLASQEQNLTSKQCEDILTISRIFPTANFDHLRQTYMLHKDIQATILDILKQTGEAR